MQKLLRDDQRFQACDVNQLVQGSQEPGFEMPFFFSFSTSVVLFM